MEINTEALKNCSPSDLKALLNYSQNRLEHCLTPEERVNCAQANAVLKNEMKLKFDNIFIF